MSESKYPPAAKQDLAQDDPFAELTRIMGHNPDSNSSPAHAETVDNLEIELENELLGDLLDDGDFPDEGGAQVISWRKPANVELEAGPEADDEALPTEAEMPLDDVSADEVATFQDVVAEGVEQDGDLSDFVEADAGQQPFAFGEADFAALDSDFASSEDGEAAFVEAEQAHDEAGEAFAVADFDEATGDEPYAAAMDETPAAGDDQEGEAPFDYARAAADRADFLSPSAAEDAPEAPLDEAGWAEAAPSDDDAVAAQGYEASPAGFEGEPWDDAAFAAAVDEVVAAADEEAPHAAAEPEAWDDADFAAVTEDAAEASPAPLEDETWNEAIFAAQPDAAGEEMPQAPHDAWDDADFAPAMEEAVAAAADEAAPAEDGEAWSEAGFAAADENDAHAATGEAYAEDEAWDADFERMIGEATASEEPAVAEEWSPAVFAAAENRVGAGGDWSPAAAQENAYEARGEGRPAAELPPEIETVEVPDRPAVAESLEIPDVSYGEDVKPAAELDEIEEILAGAFGDIETASDDPDEAWKETVSRTAGEPDAPEEQNADDYFAASMGAGLAAGAAAFAGQRGQPQYHDSRADDPVDDFGDFHSQDWAAAGEAPMAAPPPPAGAHARQPLRRRLPVRWTTAAAVAGAVVLLGGASVLAFSFLRGDDTSAPVLVRADDSPVRVRPENPGGTTIPNQDNQVYRRVSGEAADAAPAQSRLVSTTEEPVELPPATAGRVVSDTAKVEDRLGPADDDDIATAANEPVAVAPRRVRSLVVRPDGTMVPREVPEPTPRVAGAALDAGQPAAAREIMGGADAAAAGEAVDGPLSGVEAAEVDSAAGTEDTPAATATIPRTAPIPPERPANVPTASNPQVAAVAPAQQQPAPVQQPAQQQPAQQQPAQPAAAAAESGWAVQIASQPSAESAQQSYQQLAQRYGNVLQGKGVNIVRADIDGMGTFYRVRIPSSSRDEAIRICEQLKAAGGSCFVSR